MCWTRQQEHRQEQSRLARGRPPGRAVIFRPSILPSGPAGAGALIGHLHEDMSRSELKEIRETALVVVGDATVERAVDEQTKRAKK